MYLFQYNYQVDLIGCTVVGFCVNAFNFFTSCFDSVISHFLSMSCIILQHSDMLS